MTDTTHTEYAATLAACYAHELELPITSDTVDYMVDGHMGAEHAADTCPACHPPGSPTYRWWAEPPAPEPTPAPEPDPDDDAWGFCCWICDGMHENINERGEGCPSCASRGW